MPSRITHSLILLWCLSTLGCASVSLNPTNWNTPSLLSSSKAPIGTPEWWKKHRGKAVFVPRHGYQVEGVDGYFDEEGRPMVNTRVAKVVDRKISGGLLGDVRVTTGIEEIKESVGLGPDEQQAREAYAAAEGHFRRQEYKKAAELFDEAASRGRGSAIEQDALFFLGESQFFAAKYDAAIDTYGELIADFPNTKHLDKVIRRQFDIAQYWEKYHRHKPQNVLIPNNPFNDTLPAWDTLGRALKAYENIRLNDPTGPLADDSIMATANSYFLRERYADADYYYELLRTEYPRSDHQYEAHILGLQCKLRKYQGPDYDDNPLREARKLVKRLNTQFAGELSQEERDRLTEVRARLNRELALRDFNMAKYYDEKSEYGSARFYYARVFNEYPQTELAVQSRDRYVEIKEEPDSPEEPLGWLVKHMPENRERKQVASVPLLKPGVPALGEAPETRLATEPAAGGADGGTVVR